MDTTDLPAQPTSRMCFVCGRENPAGLHLHFYEDREKRQLIAPLHLPAHFQSYPGVAHGGVIAAILDEVSGRSINVGRAEELFWVTARLEIRYRKPTPVETPLTAVGWVVREGGRGAEVAAEIRLPDGSISAEATALIVAPSGEALQSWDREREQWFVER